MTSPRLTRVQVLEGVRKDVADCLAVELEEITPETNFRLDLGGESIDLLDLAFRSEKRLGIQSPFSRLTDAQRWKLDDSGRPVEEMMNWLQSEFPRIDWSSYLNGSPLSHPLDLFTMNLIADLLFDAQFADTSPVVASTSPVVATE